MSEEKQYAERDIQGLDKSGGHYCRHIMAMTAEELHSKSDIAAELAWRDEKIARMQAQIDVRDSMLSEKNSKNSYIRADRNRVQRERDAAYQALKYIVNPVPYLEQLAAAEDSVLNGNVVTVANDPHFLQTIAKKVLEGEASDIIDLWRAQVVGQEIHSILSEIGSDADAAHVVVMLRERLGRVNNVPRARPTSDLETTMANLMADERTSTGRAIYTLLLSYVRKCKYISEEALTDLLKDHIAPVAAVNNPVEGETKEDV